MSNNFSTILGKNLSDTTTLDCAEISKLYIVKECAVPDLLKTRFAELGFVEGAEVKVIKKAPLGDPLEVSVMGYSLCIRVSEAKLIHVLRCASEQI